MGGGALCFPLLVGRLRSASWGAFGVWPPTGSQDDLAGCCAFRGLPRGRLTPPWRDVEDMSPGEEWSTRKLCPGLQRTQLVVANGCCPRGSSTEGVFLRN